ncbi:hypothetical protein ACHQM5_021231 [Ranunculus cassubicifolius]
MLYKWDSDRLSMKGKRYWQLLPHAIWWGIWTARNKAKFEGEEVEDWRLLHSIVKLVWSWGLAHKELEEVRLDELIFYWDNIMFL